MSERPDDVQIAYIGSVSERIRIPSRTRVVIVGGGPAGSLLAHLLHREGIDCVVLELRTREYVLGRIRAGVIEQGIADLLREAGVGYRMDSEGFRHDGVNLAFDNRMFRVDFDALTGRHVVIYGQTELQKDLYGVLDREGVTFVDEAADLTLERVEGLTLEVSFSNGGARHTIDADFVVGCDGFHGVTRSYIPTDRLTTFEKVYPFTWVGILSETAPVRDELIYTNHDRGFALCSMRNENLSRYYVQGKIEDTVEDWSDDRFWDELSTRLPEEAASDLITGPSIEKSITPLRSWVSEPLSYGRLFLAGDAAHIVPPTGAKGLNLAISDVVYLHDAFKHFYTTGSTTGLDGYSDRALARVWKAVRFSWWMTNTMHRVSDDGFDRRLQHVELEYLEGSENARRTMAENYVGLEI